MTKEGMHFVREISAAYEAFEQLPGLQSRIEELEAQHIRDGDRVASLELRIMDLKVREDELNAKLRSVEAERDDAGFRLLEGEDKTAAAILALRNIQVTLGETLANLVGDGRDMSIQMTRQEWTDWSDHCTYKAQCEADAKRVAEEAEAQRLYDLANPPQPVPVPMVVFSIEGDDKTFTVPGPVTLPPVAVIEYATEDGTIVATDVVPGAPTPWGQTAGQSEPLPTVSVEPMPSEPVPSPSASPEASAPSPVSQPNEGKYIGKKYHDWDYYVPLTSWLAGGGTEADYHWRPSGLAQA
jgi:hypothetical protein